MVYSNLKFETSYNLCQKQAEKIILVLRFNLNKLIVSFQKIIKLTLLDQN